METQGKDGKADQSRRIVELEDELRESQSAKERNELEKDKELKNAREIARKMLVDAQEKCTKLEKENEEMKEELAILKSDVDIEGLTPEQQAIVRVALAKQAKVYRQREKDLQKRILELEEEISEPVDISAAIDEAVRCRETGEEKTIVFGLTGTGYFDMVAYEKFNDGTMSDYIPTDEDLQVGFDALPKIPGIQ